MLPNVTVFVVVLYVFGLGFELPFLSDDVGVVDEDVGGAVSYFD